MLIPSFLLSSIVSIALSTGGRTAQDCTIGDQWTKNFIRFECYEGTGLVVKGVRANGCVPTNTDNGAMIESGATFDEQYFTYRCTKKGDVVSYQIINCRDSNGKALGVGKSIDMGDGSIWKCYTDKKGNIKLSQDKPGGCLYDGKLYTVGKAWIQNNEFKATVAGVEQIIGKGIRMECISSGAQDFVGKATGCVTAAGSTLNGGAFTTVNSLNVKCTIASTGAVTMSVVDESDVTCEFEGETVKNLDTITARDGESVYRCVYGVMKKSGCIVNGVTYSANKYMVVDGKPFFCNSGAGSLNFGNITGCTLADGTIKSFWTSWVNGTESHRCRYYASKGTVITYIEIRGCWYNNRQFDKNAIITFSADNIKKCALVESKWNMRNLTTAEYTAWIQSKSVKGSQNVIGGAGGSGAGGDLMGEPTTEEPDTTPQPTRPTNPAVMSTRAVETTVKPVPSTVLPTTTTKITTTTSPSTEAPVKTSPVEMVTNQPETTIIITSKASSKEAPVQPTTTNLSTNRPETTSTATTSKAPSTETPGQPTTAVQNHCHDQFEMCSKLAPICHSPVSNVKAIIKSSNVTVEQIKEIFDILGIDKPLTSSEEEKEEMDEVIRGLAGYNSEEEDCGCTDDNCASRCQNRKRKSCKKCQIFKRKVRELVLMVCPATCGSCNTVGKVPAVIKALVRFYTHDCR